MKKLLETIASRLQDISWEDMTTAERQITRDLQKEGYMVRVPDQSSNMKISKRM